MTPIEERFWAKVDASGDCWLWTGALTTEGYGALRVGPTTGLAHRVAYELLVGPIPAGRELDHVCRVRRCVCPDHLDPVSHRRNVHRSPIAPAGRNARKTHCPQGHPYDEANTVIVPWDGRPARACRACRNAARKERHRRAAQRQKESAS